jgi:hypothetical protein
MAWTWPPGISAVHASAASDMRGPRTSTTAAKAAAATTSARQGIIWNQARGHQDGRCKTDQTVSNHDILPTLEFRMPPMTYGGNDLQR